jgi:hypothetical protein
MDVYLFFPKFSRKKVSGNSWKQSLSWWSTCLYRWLFFRIFLLLELSSLSITLTTPYLLVRYLISNPVWYVIIQSFMEGMYSKLLLHLIILVLVPSRSRSRLASPRLSFSFPFLTSAKVEYFRDYLSTLFFFGTELILRLIPLSFFLCHFIEFYFEGLDSWPLSSGTEARHFSPPSSFPSPPPDTTYPIPYDSSVCYIPLYPHPEKLPERPLVAKFILEIEKSFEVETTTESREMLSKTQ